MAKALFHGGNRACISAERASCPKPRIGRRLHAGETPISGICRAAATGRSGRAGHLENGKRRQMVQGKAIARERDRLVHSSLRSRARGKLGGLLDSPIVRAYRAGFFDPETTVDKLVVRVL